jgi:hypothetical protein
MPDDDGMAAFPDLDTALEQLYSAFARFPLPEHSDFCDHCVHPDEVAATRGKPLRSLTADDLRPYVSHAMSTWGELAEFKYFFPRVLELFAREEIYDSGLAWLFLNKVSVRWEDWPEDERAAIRAFLGAWWRTMLGEFPRQLDVMEMLDIIAQLGIHIGPYLAYWEAIPGEEAARHLAWLIQVTCHSASNDEWYEIMRRWIEGPAAARILESAFAAATTPNVAAELSLAQDILARWTSG